MPGLINPQDILHSSCTYNVRFFSRLLLLLSPVVHTINTQIIAGRDYSMAAADVQQMPVQEPAPPALPDYLTDPDAVLKDTEVKWRYGKAPDYSKTRKVFSESQYHRTIVNMTMLTLSSKAKVTRGWLSSRTRSEPCQELGS